LFSPRNPKHVATFGHLFGRLSPVFGLKVELRKPADAESYGNAIYIANHQNNYDMVTASNIVQAPTVTVGKKSLLWIPFFGQLYWLTGNLLIDRNNRTKAHGTIAEVVNALKSVKFRSGCSRKGPAAAAAACCRLKPALFTRLLPLGCRLFRCVSRIHRIK
jgi:1-acyl-sn-glycerol-3-phosphate acyltransferase